MVYCRAMSAVSPGAPPPPHAVAPARREARWFPPILVLVVMAVIILGGYVVAAAVGPERGLSVSGGQIQIGGFTVAVPDGWVVEREIEQFAEGAPAVQLARGQARALIVAFPNQPDPAALLEIYVSQILAPEAVDARVSDVFQVQGQLGPGVQQAYIGTFQGVSFPLEGDVTVFAGASGSGLVVDGWSAEGQYGTVQNEVHEMAATAGEG